MTWSNDVCLAGDDDGWRRHTVVVDPEDPRPRAAGADQVPPGSGLPPQALRRIAAQRDGTDTFCLN